MSVTINVVVTCTKRKSVAVPDGLKFRRVRKAAIATKVALWQERLEAVRAETMSVRDLYSGDHWSIARTMENTSSFRGANVRLWVASAGYGLVSLDNCLKPYSATFSGEHPDSIAKKTTGDDRQSIFGDWWKLMAKWDGPGPGEPRTIAEIAADSPNAPLLVIASEKYLMAIESDLRTALESLRDREFLSIFSAGCKSLNGLAQHLVPYDARLQQVVGGALRSLNMRVAHKAIAESRRSLPTLPVLCRKFKRLVNDQPALSRIERKPMTDVQVRTFIARELRKESEACHTPLLRKLRDNGQACEQKRFANLYREVREQLNGS
jgi:hypothetical protein